MKLYCLSGHPTLPCNVLKFKSTTIMLDCGLDTTSVLNFLPLPLVHSPRLSKLPGWVSKDGSINLEKELKECGGRVFVDSQPELCLPERELMDLSTIDVILISNYHCMMALPYITEHSGFTGAVYATEPTLQIGRLLMEELVNHMERVPKAQTATCWKNKEIQRLLPGPLKDVAEVWAWKRCYTIQEVNSALSKVQLVGYSQKVELFGAVQVSPLSSGYSLGSSNWIIQSHYEKVSYMSGSSLLTTHPQPMDQSSLKNSDILILTGLTQMPTANPDGMLGEFCSNLAMTIRAGGNVLVPCYSSGVIYDLLECLYQFIDSANLGSTPFYFISPIANSSLEFSQIFAEWLCHNKQSKVYLPEPPFPHAELIQTNKLKHYPSIHGDFSSEFRQPCVVFTGHPSLRFGDVVHFMELWGRSSLNTIIFTEPDFSYLDALAPYQPLAMKCVYCPIDTRLNFHQVSKLLKEIQLAKSLVPSEVKPGVSVATVSGMLQSKDNKHTLMSVPRPPPAAPTKKRKRVAEEPPELLAPKPLLSGAVPLDGFLATLHKHGVSEVKVEETADGHILHLQAEDALIQMEAHATHIVCDNNEPMRTTLRDLVLRFLQKL
ncbi:integrator complex subunit 9 isoform X2 [Gadus morhua]|uniref:integrator complex subunit 9 isoform X2 n=1 Tax=Gadus morhua TaxID=8049 RepID=UPI0011B356F8|nr:integrator complex subunit 9 isoform X2 [Gadus morhua]